MIWWFKRKLPTGLSEFHAWSNRIIKKAGLPSTPESQKYALANIAIELPRTTAKAKDSFFVDSLQKAAINQVCDYYRKEQYAKKQEQERLAKEKQNQAEATPPKDGDGKVLEIKGV